MAKIPDYKKDEHTGAVIFKDSNAYQQRRKVVEQNKLNAKASKDSNRSINSMKKEIRALKKVETKMTDQAREIAELKAIVTELQKGN